MKKDLKSYVEHNKDYEGQFGIDSFRKNITDYEDVGLFKREGFEKAISMVKERDTHIDIGSGGGWLLFKTSPLFKKVIGIEPSKAACENAKKLINEFGYTNIELIDRDMIDAIQNLSLQKPVFFTTAIVLSHIKNFYIKDFLSLLNTVPDNSTLFFSERYDKNIHQPLWYIRRKYWWAKHLPEWQLEFFDLSVNGYKSGIFGKKVGKINVTNTYKPTMMENVLWFFDGVKNSFFALMRFIKRKF